MRSTRLFRLLVVVGTFVASQAYLHAQGLTDCKELVRRAYTLLGEEIAQQKAVALEYTVRTTMSDSIRHKPSTSQIRMVAGSGSIRVVSREMEVYQDATTAVTVVHARRSIYIAASSPTALQQRRYSSLGASRDSLLNSASVVTCSDVSGPGGAHDKMVVFALNRTTLPRPAMMRATIVLDQSNNMPRRFRLDYAPGHNVAWVEVIYTKVDLQYPTTGLSDPVLGLVVGKNGKPLGRYAGYAIVDTR